MAIEMGINLDELLAHSSVESSCDSECDDESESDDDSSTARSDEFSSDEVSCFPQGEKILVTSLSKRRDNNRMWRTAASIIISGHSTGCFARTFKFYEAITLSGWSIFSLNTFSIFSKSGSFRHNRCHSQWANSCYIWKRYSFRSCCCELEDLPWSNANPGLFPSPKSNANGTVLSRTQYFTSSGLGYLTQFNSPR